MKPIKVGKVGRSYTFAEVLANAQKRAAEEEARYNAMSPEERVAYQEEQKKKAKEAEEILKKLRGPGFVEVKIR